MKSWSVYLPNGEAVTVVGEIECRDGKYYFKNGDDVVAVFNDDKVCGVSKDDSPYIRGQYPQEKHNCLMHIGVLDIGKMGAKCSVCGRYVTRMEMVTADKFYPQGDEG